MLHIRSTGRLLLLASVALWPTLAAADNLSDAQKSIAKGDTRTALIQLRNAVKADPQNAAARYQLARVEFDLGDAVAAETDARGARERGYDPHAVVPLLMQTYLTQGKFDQLLKDFQIGNQDPILDSQILVARGFAQLGLHQADDARASFAQAQKMAPNAIEPLLAEARVAMGRNDLATAQDRIDRALALQPKAVEALLAKAQLLRVKGDPKAALPVLDDAVAAAPTNMRAKLDRAGALIALGEDVKAQADIQAVQHAMPGNVEAIYLQALLLVRAKDFKGADALLDKLSPVVARIPRAYFLQAIVKQNLGQLEQAQEAADRYLARNPNDMNAYKIVAKIALERRQPDRAIVPLNKVANSDQADAETFDLLGRAYAMSGQPQEAVRAFQKAEALAPNDVGLNTRLAAARMGAGDPNAAVGDLERSLELAPKQAAVGEALFFAALATGDTNKAADALGKIRAAQGDTPAVENLDGLLKMAELDLDGARTVFTALVAKNPDFLPAKVNLARLDAMQGRMDDARQIFADILTKQPASQPALTIIVSGLVQGGKLPEAIAVAEKARAAAPDNPQVTTMLAELYVRNNDAAKALELVNADKALPTSMQLLAVKAAAQIALKQTTQARDTYNQMITLEPTAIAPRRALAALFVQAGDNENARATIQAAMAALPNNYQLMQDYIAIDYKTGGIDAALATADRLAQQDRTFAAGGALRGDVYVAAKRYDDAAAAYAAAQAATPSTLLVTREASALVAAGHTDQARKLLQDWLTQHPDDMTAVSVLSGIAINDHDYAAAAALLQKVLAKNPHDAASLNNLAWVYQQQNDPRAKDLAQQAYILAPGAQTADTLGWILTSAGNPGTGIALLRQASAEQGNDPRIAYHLAVALKDTGQKDAAIKLLTALTAPDVKFDEKPAAQQLLTDLTKGT